MCYISRVLRIDESTVTNHSIFGQVLCFQNRTIIIDINALRNILLPLDSVYTLLPLQYSIIKSHEQRTDMKHKCLSIKYNVII